MRSVATASTWSPGLRLLSMVFSLGHSASLPLRSHQIKSRSWEPHTVRLQSGCSRAPLSQPKANEGVQSVRCWRKFVALSPVSQGGSRSVSIAPPQADAGPTAPGAMWTAPTSCQLPWFSVMDGEEQHPRKAALGTPSACRRSLGRPKAPPCGGALVEAISPGWGETRSAAGLPRLPPRSGWRRSERGSSGRPA